jgi:GMP reductase
MQIINDVKLDFQDVLLIPKRSEITSRSEINLERNFKFKYSPEQWAGVPIISSNMTSVTTRKVTFAMERNKMLACLPKDFQAWAGTSREHTLFSFGITAPFHTSLLSQVKFICLDVANGYTEKFIETVKKTRERFSDCIIVAGNVVTPSQVESLVLAGADVVKVGIGSGSACATRIKTGVGYPQLSAIIECSDAAHGLNGHIISDGGCTSPADVVKAFAAGADFVMLGGMLAGHDENGQEFYGMSSERANNEFAGGLKDYKASEGWEITLPKRGPLQNTLNDITGGLRSACAYVGAKNLKDLPKCATFVRVNNQINTSLLEYRNGN